MLFDFNGFVYHGSIIQVEYIDLSKSRNKLDFGKGFYVTSSYQQACRWSEIKYNRVKGIEAVKAVSKYSVTGFNGLNVKEFKNAGHEWLEFIVQNRREEVTQHNYDIVIGHIADDTTLLVINTYINGLYGVGDEAVKIAISLLKPEMLENQYAFCTEKAIAKLKFEGCVYL